MNSRRTATSLPQPLRDNVLSSYLGGFHAIASKSLYPSDSEHCSLYLAHTPNSRLMEWLHAAFYFILRRL